MIFLWRSDDGEEEREYVLLDSGMVGETMDEERAILIGETTLEQWLHDKGSKEDDYLLLVRRVG